jgi:hypothetical protein
MVFMSDIHVREVKTKQDQVEFLRVPHLVFESDRNWIAPLTFERMEHISPLKNPYFKHAKAQLFAAFRDGVAVGRISAQIDDLHLGVHKDSTGQFGFLDAVDDPLVFAALFQAAERWLTSHGVTRVRGPFTFSINDETGLLVDGFETPPSMMMGHALPYYAKHVEAYGFKKVKDVFAYDYDLRVPLAPTIERAGLRAARSKNISVRPLNKSRMTEELDIIMSIFNDAWSNNWGFIPFTQDELIVLGKNLKLLVNGEFVAIASIDGVPSAMAITLPNLNEWFAGLKGALLPFGWAMLVPKIASKRSKTVRLPMMGVRKIYQDSATGSALAFSVIMALRDYHLARGVERVEMSWVLEDNRSMRHIIEAAGGVAYKTYRVYEKGVGT